MAKTANINQPRYNYETEMAMNEARKIMNNEIETKTYNSFSELIDEVDTEN